MTRKLLITSAAALLAGTVLAAGQESQRSQPGAQPGAVQEHQAPKAQQPPQGQREQKTPAQPNSRAQDRPQSQRPSTTGQGQREEAPGERPRQQQQAPTERREGQDNNRRDRAQGQNDNRRDEGRNPREDRREGQDSRNNRDRTQGQGPGRASTSVTLTTEQRTRIRETVLVGGSAPRVTNVNFSIRVGTAIPRSVHVVTVPTEIVEIYPAWRGFLYFVYQDEIIIVDPRTHRIVAVLDV